MMPPLTPAVHDRRVTPESPGYAFGLSRRQSLAALALAGSAAAACTVRPPPAYGSSDQQSSQAEQPELSHRLNAGFDNPLERLGMEETEVLSSEATLLRLPSTTARAAAASAVEDAGVVGAARLVSAAAR